MTDDPNEDLVRDPMYDQAVGLFVLTGRASTMFLQRRLSIGYNAAARLIERAEDDGVVSRPDHVGKRDVLISAALRARVAELKDHCRVLAEVLRPFGFFDEDGGDAQRAWEIRYRDGFQDWVDFADIERARAALDQHQKIMEAK